MLYLIDPRGAVWSADTTIGRARARARVDGRPVDDLQFTKAAMLLTFDDHVDLALRHGVAAPRGLLLDHGFVAQVLAPANLKAQRANQDAIAEQLAVVERRTEDVGSLRSHRHAAAYEGHLDQVPAALITPERLALRNYDGISVLSLAVERGFTEQLPQACRPRSFGPVARLLRRISRTRTPF